MKFKIGDKVRVTHATHHESVWCNIMDEAIGKEYEVVGVEYSANCYYLSFRGGDYYFPEDSFELAKPLVHTYKEWYALAKEKNIPGRSKMNKEQLVQAVREYKEPILPLGDELRKKVGKKQSCCHFAKEFENGKRTYHVNAPCHASLGLEHKENCAVLVDDIGYVQQPPIYKDFVHYMLNESPFKDQFLTKDVEKAIQHGVYYDVDKEYNRVVCSAVALRQGDEHAYKLSAFKYFKEKGFSANVSWCLAQLITLIDGKFGLDNMGGGHDVFCNTMAADSFFKFFKEGFWNPVINSYRNKKEFYSLFSAITPREMDRYEKRHKKQTIVEFVAKEIPFQRIGEGFNTKKVYREVDILTFANKVKALLE